MMDRPETTEGGDAPRSLSSILDRVEDADRDGKVSINDVLGAFSDTSTGVLVTLLGLLAALPIIGAIPGISMTVSALILIAVGRAALGRHGAFHVPGRLGRVAVAQERFKKGVERGRWLTDKVDALVRQRLTLLTDGALARALILVSVCVLSVTMVPLAFVPWGVTAPAFGIVAFGVALIAGDGLFAAFGYGMIAATVGTFLWVV
ncbi:exopolysaccharide biosynthesis protein [Acuticoccus sp.]|uniref:exopolysaccharide biosynthesis protein n=1 Tax=Acuticoccus sp. TaxID=1904378 RepID=UPI003B524468